MSRILLRWNVSLQMEILHFLLFCSTSRSIYSWRQIGGSVISKTKMRKYRCETKTKHFDIWEKCFLVVLPPNLKILGSYLSQSLAKTFPYPIPVSFLISIYDFMEEKWRKAFSVTFVQKNFDAKLISRSILCSIMRNSTMNFTI